MAQASGTDNKIKETSTSVNFEDTLSDVESIVNEIESGQLPLQDLVDKFKQAIHKINECQQLLKETEQEIKVMEQRTSSNQK